eukprot:6188552-Pleurochrysis_carterae.AAC.1
MSAYNSAPKTPDLLKRVKAFCMAEARQWWAHMNNVLTQGEIRIFLTELFKKLYPDETLDLNDARRTAMRARIRYVLR